MRYIPLAEIDAKIAENNAKSEIAYAELARAREAFNAAQAALYHVQRNTPDLLLLRAAVAANPVIVAGAYVDYVVESVTPKRALIHALGKATGQPIRVTEATGNTNYRHGVSLQACRDAWVAAGRKLPG